MTLYFRPIAYFCGAKLFHGIKLGVKTHTCLCPFFISASNFRSKSAALPSLISLPRVENSLKSRRPFLFLVRRQQMPNVPPSFPKPSKLWCFLFCRTTCHTLPIDVNFPIFVGTNGSCNSLISICC